ncbi:hypothetical protein [Streptomyces sp. NPDC001450]
MAEQYAHALVQPHLLLGHEDELGPGADKGAGEHRVGTLLTDVLEAVGAQFLFCEGQLAGFRAGPQAERRLGVVVEEEGLDPTALQSLMLRSRARVHTERRRVRPAITSRRLA